MHVAGRATALVAAAVLLTFASTMVTRTRLEVQDWDCPPAPASCARPVLVGGFPLTHISDFHGISVVGSVSVVGGLLGEDNLHWRAFTLNAAFYLLVMLAAPRALRLIAPRRAA